MYFWSRLKWRLRHGWRKSKLEAELDEEMGFHLEMLRQETGGAARREFGNVTRMREESRAQWGFEWLEGVAKDLRFAGRGLKREWPSTLAAVGALSLGIGFSIAVFTLVNAVLLRPLPYKNPDRLVMVWAVNQEQGWDQEKVSGPEMLEWKRSGLFEGLVGFSPNMTAVTGPGEPTFTHGYAVTPGFLPLLGIQPMLGRAFTEEEERKGGAKNRVLLRHSFWKNRFGADPGIVGRTILIEDRPYVVVGVMGPEFQFFNRQTDLYVPTPWEISEDQNRGRGLRVIARLKDGISLQQAQAQATALAARFAQDYPASNRGWTVRLAPVPMDTTGPVRQALWVLLGSVGMVLLIACTNVTSLLLAQGVARAREISLRVALGAGSGRILRQLLTESLLLAVVSGGLGFLIGQLAVDYFQNTLPAQYSVGRFLIQMERIRIDAWVAIFAAGIVPVCAVAFGFVPAWRSSRSAKASGSARKLQNFLVAGEIALAMVLTIGAGLLARSFQQLYSNGPGFDSHSLQSIFVAIPTYGMRITSREEGQAKVGPLYEKVLNDVGATAGVEGVAAVNHLPLAGFYALSDLVVEGLDKTPQAIDRCVSNNYHELLKIPLVAGRYFDRTDAAGRSAVAIINEPFARRYFGGKSPLGLRIRYQGNGQLWHTIVGVVGAEKSTDMGEEAKPILYRSLSQNTFSMIHIIVKSPMGLAATVKATMGSLHGIDSKFAPYEVRTWDDLVLDSTWRVRYSMMLLLAMSGVALVLSTLGVYGVLSYSVRKRTREIGVRMALGASRLDILEMVAGEGLRLGVMGIAAGVAASAVFSRFLNTLLVGVRHTEPAIYAGVALLLGLTVLAASLAPARRATTLMPGEALREE